MQKRQRNSYLFILFVLSVSLFTTCKTDKGVPDFRGYPTQIGKLINTKCAIPGCHNEVSKEGAGNLSLETWESMLVGEDHGPCIIPYRPDFSTLFFFVNSYTDLGLTLQPRMPFNKPALSRDEVIMLRDWIKNGAPDKSGYVRFSDNPLRRKFYVTNQGCDVVTVFDEETGVPMRYVDVGKTPAIESPHMIRVSPDGQYWYVVFTSGSYVQRFRTSDESFAGELNIGSGNWNSITISNDSKYAFVVDWSANGRIAYIDLTTMTLATPIWQGTNLFQYPHGGAINKTNDTLYVTGQTGNFIYKIPVIDPASAVQVSLQQPPFETYTPPITSSSLDIHEITFTPDYSKYFLTCQKTNEVRVMKTSNDSLLNIIPVGLYPQELSISTTSNYLFVSCPEDTVTFPGFRGSVAVINYSTNSLVTKIFTGFQPHGIAVDDINHQVYVANRNITTKGPATHHLGVCGGRNGYVSYIDLNTLQLVQSDDGDDKHIEISVDPYSVAIR